VLLQLLPLTTFFDRLPPVETDPAVGITSRAVNKLRCFFDAALQRKDLLDDQWLADFVDVQRGERTRYVAVFGIEMDTHKIKATADLR
jgi:hypothetical protein